MSRYIACLFRGHARLDEAGILEQAIAAIQ
jgi:hypothetical protein